MERVSGTPGGLLGRRRECAALDELIAGVKGGRSASLVLRGEAGIGKSALLAYARDQASGYRVARVVGIEAEAELAFGGLHQLCAPFRDHFDHLPDPQRLALETAFGLSAGNPPDRFLVGLAVLSLLADVAEEQPLVCLVDDAQWLDQISAQTLAFVARRLLAERLLLLFAMRPASGHPLQGLPHLEVEGLADHDARVLLASVTLGRFDDRVRDRLLAEARGNPLALLELPRGLTAAELAGELGGPDDRPLAGQIERGFLRRLRSLTPDAQRLLLVAAAEPVGDVVLLRRAAEGLGIDVDSAATEAEIADLVTLRSMVRFRHPLVRSAAYRAASLQQRREVHRALADATDPDHDPDRRAWHLASAVSVADEDVASGLERAAARASARGGVAAAAAFLDRAAQLTPDPAVRGSRALAAAQAKSQAGEYGEAVELLNGAQLSPLDERDQAQADLVRGQLMFASRSASAGLPLLLSAAHRLESLDPELAKETYRDAMYAAFTAGELPGEVLEEVAAAVLRMAPQDRPSRSDLLLEGVARVYTDGYAAGVPLLHRALAAYRTEGVSAADIGWLPIACRMAHNFWDFDSWSVLSAALVDLTRELGALSVLPSALLLRLSNRMYAGDLATAQSLANEAATIGDVTGSSFFARYGVLVVAPWSGSETATRAAIDAIVNDPQLSTEGKVLTATEWAAAVLYNGLGRSEGGTRRRAARSRLPEGDGPLFLGDGRARRGSCGVGSHRGGRRDRPHGRRPRRGRGHRLGAGTAALLTAQVSDDTAAEALYREALERLRPTGVDMEVARTHLLYGEWLARAGRTADAQRNLRLAHDLLSRMGATGFVERARRGLEDTGATTAAPTRTVAPRTTETLTPQESQIARLAADGLTNPEIGAQLYISAHTVEWHLRKVFSKLGIRSRRDIGAVLADEAPA